MLHPHCEADHRPCLCISLQPGAGSEKILMNVSTIFSGSPVYGGLVFLWFSRFEVENNEWVSWGLGTAPACAGARSQFAGGAGGEAASECLLPHSPWWPPLGLPQLGGPLSPQTLRGSGKGEVCLLDGRPLTTARGGRGGSPGPSVAGRLQGADPGWWLRCRRGRGEGGRGPPAHAPASVWSRLQGDPLLLPSAPSPCHSRSCGK